MHTSEVPYLATLNPAVNLWLKNGSGNPTAPYDGYVINDCASWRDARGLSTVVLTFDDTAVSGAHRLPILADLVLHPSAPSTLRPTHRHISRMTSTYRDALSYGADIQLSLDPTDTTSSTTNASVSEVMDKLLASREWLLCADTIVYAQHFC